MANSLMALFGTPQDPLMLGGASTVVGFMRKLGQFSNAITWLDEYKNDIGEKKIESLKNIWDRVGYERGTKDQTNKTQTTPVTSSAIISGQEMPNVEPALFSRTVLCEFRASQRSQQEVNDFNTLRRMVARHYPAPHTFVCVTDDAAGFDPDIRVVPAWNDFASVPMT